MRYKGWTNERDTSEGENQSQSGIVRSLSNSLRIYIKGMTRDFGAKNPPCLLASSSLCVSETASCLGDASSSVQSGGCLSYGGYRYRILDLTQPRLGNLIGFREYQYPILDLSIPIPHSRFGTGERKYNCFSMNMGWRKEDGRVGEMPPVGVCFDVLESRGCQREASELEILTGFLKTCDGVKKLERKECIVKNPEFDTRCLEIFSADSAEEYEMVKEVGREDARRKDEKSLGTRF
ncbi:hypothetical protein CEXT_112421 [Caerostris extrusa]|uniref:Uncharacterized protein n=1 Tax=Caerostris extrusa TaxID=172846 RepID=A0AAV4SLA8_CAEEX|nr:hypothetical protein CEXT_112421 [Caerostris extrusa]